MHQLLINLVLCIKDRMPSFHHAVRHNHSAMVSKRFTPKLLFINRSPSLDNTYNILPQKYDNKLKLTIQDA